MGEVLISLENLAKSATGLCEESDAMGLDEELASKRTSGSMLKLGACAEEDEADSGCICAESCVSGGAVAGREVETA